MRVSLLVMALALLGAPLSAQRTETLVRSGQPNGGFGGPVLMVGSILGDPALFVGGRGGWVAGRTLSVGGGGYGLVNDNIEAPAVFTGGRRAIVEMGYGGFELEYLHRAHELAHFSIYALLGGGSVRYRDRDRYESLGDDAFLVLKPAAQMTLNVTDFFRMSAGAGWRWTWGADLPGLGDNDLSGAAGMLTLRFGRY
jgi:hypothetical protein